MARIDEIRKALTDSAPYIKASLQNVLNSQDQVFNYRTFGSAVEPFAEKALVSRLESEKIICNKNDYFIAPNKNHFPDFELSIGPKIAIDFKVGSLTKKRGDHWVSCSNSNNDLGTFNSWRKKIKLYGGENIYYIFIIYDLSDSNRKIVDIQISPFYNFIGLNSAGFLKYREKDGNLRPRDFFEKPKIQTFQEFRSLFRSSEEYRSKRIIRKHQSIVRSAPDFI